MRRLTGTVQFSLNIYHPLKRRYKWDDVSEIRTLTPRKERWYGKLGAYDPANTYVWEIFKPRIVAEDSQLHFESMDGLRGWLVQGSSIMDWVYTSDGLVVGFAKASSRNQVNIEIYQLFVDGEKPSRLVGSRPGNIKVMFRELLIP